MNYHFVQDIARRQLLISFAGKRIARLGLQPEKDNGLRTIGGQVTRVIGGVPMKTLTGLGIVAPEGTE